MEKKHYHGIDWLRAMACIGIVMMHIQANNTYHLSGFIAEKMIPSFTDFTFLFMTNLCLWYVRWLLCKSKKRKSELGGFL